jgi:ABC-type proline/glycine betaine transport system permease subunit
MKTLTHMPMSRIALAIAVLLVLALAILIIANSIYDILRWA